MYYSFCLVKPLSFVFEFQIVRLIYFKQLCNQYAFIQKYQPLLEYIKETSMIIAKFNFFLQGFQTWIRMNLQVILQVMYFEQIKMVVIKRQLQQLFQELIGVLHLFQIRQLHIGLFKNILDIILLSNCNFLWISSLEQQGKICKRHASMEVIQVD